MTFKNRVDGISLPGYNMNAKKRFPKNVWKAEFKFHKKF